MKKNNKKVKRLVFASIATLMICFVGTYAWFVGMKTVNVSKFDIDIATTEGLFLSMDGENWSYNLDVKNATAYDGNTNTWAADGLIPMSTIGDMDATVSRMILFEKGSLTTTRGGYRLLASRVHNYDQANEAKGYVAFDLFIKNLSGTEYYVDNNELNEEAIYLTTNSSVRVSEAGGIANTGIENSVRVAFTQIGRVIGTTGADQVDDITGITCDDSNEEGHAQVTGICRNAQIWEPNDTAHVQNAINWYDTSCSQRLSTGSNLTLAASYDRSEDCGTVANGTAVPTYAVSRELLVADNVDVYDGLSFNTYTATTADYATYRTAVDADATAKSDYRLVSYPYFTDTMKDLTGTNRPTFMTLAPNSITKLRVYIYIEGQDIDNYDFASLGKQISINFGFTKERYTETDVDYVGPSTNITPTGSN